MRRAVDDRGSPGQFVLTGSSVPADDVARHTGAGRFSFLRMRPMTLFESGHTNGAVSLAALLAGEPPRSDDPGLTVATSPIGHRSVAGRPNRAAAVADAARAARDYLEQIREVDVSRVAGSKRDPARIERLLRSLARNTATEVAITVLATDAGGADGPLGRHTVAEYLTILERLMVIEDQPAWAPHLRSRAVLRTSPKRHFVDPSLAVAALAAGPDRLLADLNLLGLLFESLVIRDLRVLAQPLDGQVLHYRDNYGVEADAVVQLADGRWGAFEVKLGAGLVDEGAEALLRFRESIDTRKSGEPSVLAVIAGTGFGYLRPDGIAVIPVGCPRALTAATRRRTRRAGRCGGCPRTRSGRRPRGRTGGRATRGARRARDGSGRRGSRAARGSPTCRHSPRVGRLAGRRCTPGRSVTASAGSTFSTTILWSQPSPKS